VIKTAENAGTGIAEAMTTGIDMMTAGAMTSIVKAMTNRGAMLWTIFVILVILWALGLVSGYTIGGFIHILLVIAIVVVLIRIIQGRRPL